MARRRVRRQSSEFGSWVLGSALLLIAAILGSTYVFYFIQSRNAPQLDKETYCPIDGPTSVTAVLFDISDPIEHITQMDLRNQLNAVAKDVTKGGLIAVYVIGTDGAPSPLYRLCNPGDGSELNQIIANPRTARERWEKVFSEPLEKALFEVDLSSTANISPIIASIQNVKIDLFDTEKTAGDRRFVIVSDMVENTEKYSQYKVGVGFETYTTSGATKLRNDALSGISFDILYIRRPHLPFGSVEHISFWTEWFKYFGAKSVRAIQLEGAV